jgi:hypothetical protein
MADTNKQQNNLNFFQGMLIQGGLSSITGAISSIGNIMQLNNDAKFSIKAMERATEEHNKAVEKTRKDAQNFIGMQASTLLDRGIGLSGGGDMLLKSTENTAKLQIQETTNYYNDYVSDIYQQIKDKAKAQTFNAVIGAVSTMAQIGVGYYGYQNSKSKEYGGLNSDGSSIVNMNYMDGSTPTPNSYNSSMNIGNNLSSSQINSYNPLKPTSINGSLNTNFVW